MSANYNFTNQNRIDKGANYFLNLTWKDAAGLAYNLTNYSAVFKISVAKGLSQIYTSELTTHLAIDAINGKISLNIPASITSSFNYGSFYYSLVLTNNSTITRLLEGTIEVG